MFKRVLFSAAILISCPAFVFSQDISFLFGGGLPEAGGGIAQSTLTDLVNVNSGSVNIYSAAGFNFDAIDLDFFSSDASVAQITGGEAFNPTTIVGDRFDISRLTVAADGASGNLFSVRVLGAPLPGFLTGENDPLFDPLVGALFLARVDYDIVGPGEVEFSFGLGDQGIVELPNISLSPTFGNATLTVVPEPSSAIMLIMGCAAMAARRKRV